MDAPLTKLRVVTAFNVFRVGDVLERMPGVARDMLKQRWYGRKLVEEIKDVPAPVAATATPATQDAEAPAEPAALPFTPDDRPDRKRKPRHLS